MTRFSRVVAVAHRDLKSELSGRHGAGLLAITALLLGGVVLAPAPPPSVRPAVHTTVTVGGDAPAAVVALEGVALVPAAQADLIFREADDGTLLVQGTSIPGAVRRVLDEPEAEVRRVSIPDQTPWAWPGRSLLLALLATSALTGALSESVGGERSRNTLDALLTASVSRWEIVLGKWLAWSAFGAGSGLVAALGTIALQRQAVGPWLLSLGFVPAATVALGLAMNRQVRDVLTGATISMRWLPIAVSGSATLAWLLGRTDPLLGALVPLGGALIATGDTWPGLAPVIVACASSTLFAVLMLRLTVRDLGTDPVPHQGRSLRDAAIATSIAAAAWWAPVLSVQLWSPAGNPAITDASNPTITVLAGAVGLALLAMVRIAQGNQMPPVAAQPLKLLAATVTGIVLAGWAQSTAGLPLHSEPWLTVHHELVAARLGHHTALPVLLTAIAAQELLFRGWLQQHAGMVASVTAWTFVICPTQPLVGLGLGLLLALASRAGGITVSWALHITLLLSPVGMTLGPVGLLMTTVALAAVFKLRGASPLTPRR